MRILYHHRTQAEDGQAVHIRSLIEAFRAEGHEVHEEALVRRTGSAPQPKPDAGGSGAWSALGRLPRFARELAEYAYSVPARRRLIRAGEEFKAQLLYERYAFGNTSGVSASRRLGVPMVLEVNSPMVLELSKTRGLSFPRLANRTERWTFQEADRVCVVTHVLADMLKEMGVAEERLFVTPNGVHPESYADPDPAGARKALGIEAVTGPVLGFVGYYRPWHRLDLVVDRLGARELVDAHLVLIGEGPAEEELRRQAQARGVAERVHFVGPRAHSEIPALLPAFDVGLVPAINPYASPLKLHEYMAAGLPSVAPDQPNLREVLTPGEEALLFSPGDVDGLCAALAALVSDADLRARMGERARETLVARDLTWRGNARRVLAAVEGLS
ncbi:MAG TPA: glycosyltransferase family 4 protein [Planctomycetota bacterium]|nr:glycosyltransferase family 4 protein [Planctomycetota bacterium]